MNKSNLRDSFLDDAVSTPDPKFNSNLPLTINVKMPSVKVKHLLYMHLTLTLTLVITLIPCLHLFSTLNLVFSYRHLLTTLILFFRS